MDVTTSKTSHMRTLDTKDLAAALGLPDSAIITIATKHRDEPLGVSTIGGEPFAVCLDENTRLIAQWEGE